MNPATMAGCLKPSSSRRSCASHSRRIGLEQAAFCLESQGGSPPPRGVQDSSTVVCVRLGAWQSSPALPALCVRVRSAHVCERQGPPLQTAARRTLFASAALNHQGGVQHVTQSVTSGEGGREPA